MRFDTETIRAAFLSHHQKYGRGSRAWDPGHHVDCWELGHKAFRKGSFEDFRELYDQLQRVWHVLRGTNGEPWSAEVLYDHLSKLNVRWTRQRLSDIRQSELRGLRGVLEGLSGMKPVKHGISIVAMSKFLHFLNPRLFLIVDWGVMWRWVFAHSWLWSRIASTANNAGLSLEETPDRSDSKCDLNAYLAILLWCGEILRANTGIPEHFEKHVSEHARIPECLAPLSEYEAAAIEWFLLGLVELPPAGIR